ncbi:hypothetical protein D3C74_487570 [compost metagenome]
MSRPMSKLRCRSRLLVSCVAIQVPDSKWLGVASPSEAFWLCVVPCSAALRP